MAKSEMHRFYINKDNYLTPMINKINNINIFPAAYSKKNRKTTANISFKGLTSDFKKHIFLDSKTLEKLYNVKQSTIIGKLPEDITKAICNKSSSKKEKEDNIKKLLSSFSLAFEDLRELEYIEALQFVKNFNPDAYIKENPDLTSLYLNEMQDKFEEYHALNGISYELIKQYAKMASGKIERTSKEIGIIPKDGKVKIEYMGAGRYSNAYNVSFLDENNKKLFHDKTIKIYKDKKVNSHVGIAILKKLSEYCKERDFPSLYEDIINYRKANGTFKNNLEDSIKAIKSLYNRLKDIDCEKLKTRTEEILQLEQNMHGFYIETNRALYIKNRTGNLRYADFVEPHFFDMENQAAVYETADGELPRVKKRINLVKYELGYFDNNDQNTINGRTVDYGAITPHTHFNNTVREIFNIFRSYRF